VTRASKYDAKAQRWTEREYADARGYLAHRARLVVELGPRLEPGDRVLDLACGDGGLGEHLRARGLVYVGADSSLPMVEAARRRLGDGTEILHGDLNELAPANPVAATTCFRAIYYARDRAAFFRHVAAFTEKKLVFDLNPRQYPLDAVRADLGRAGFDRVELRPFFAPQRVSPPAALGAVLRVAEAVGPVARLALRFRFSYLVAAARTRS